MSTKSVHLFKGLKVIALVLAFFQVIACSDVADEEPERETPVVQVPPPEPEFELDTLNELFIGAVGCEARPSISLVNYDPALLFDPATCDANSNTVAGNNPTKLVSMDSGLYAYLDTEYDAAWTNEHLVFVEQGNVGVIDLVNNEARGLRTFAGDVCEVIPALRYEKVLNNPTSTETWHKINQPFVYVETVSGESGQTCDDKAAFRRYFQLALNYDAFASDFDTCSSEVNGKSTAPDCKTRIMPSVTAAQAHSVLIRGWVLDGAGPDKIPQSAYLGWGEDENRLKLWDENLELLWEQVRELETFDVVMDGSRELAANTLFRVTELTDAFYLVQLGRDHFVFEGHELIEASDPEDVLSDRVYLADERVIAGTPPTSQIKVTQVADTGNDVVIYDQGKFFAKDYKAGFVAPTSVLNYVFTESLNEAVSDLQDDFEFSQFDLTDCQFSTDEADCDAANDFESAAWQLTSLCDAILGCNIPVDNTDYCVTDAEKTLSTPQEDLCTPSRFQDLNELDEVANDLSFRAFVPYSVDFMRGIEFEPYGDELLVRVQLLERDALLVYDHNQPLAAPKAVREKRLFGERLNQIFMKPVVANNGIFVTSLVRGAEQTNRCYKGYAERVCELDNFTETDGPTCTGLDVQLGVCRASTFVYESRSLFCTDAQIASSACDDDNQVGTLERQIETATQDAKWLPTLLVDTSGYSTAMSVLISEAQPESLINPTLSYIEREGVLGNPTLYNVALPGVTLGSEIAQLSNRVESVPQPMILRDQSAQLSVNQEEFTGSDVFRTQAEHYVDQAAQSSVLVIDAIYEQ